MPRNQSVSANIHPWKVGDKVKTSNRDQYRGTIIHVDGEGIVIHWTAHTDSRGTQDLGEYKYYVHLDRIFLLASSRPHEFPRAEHFLVLDSDQSA